jgi:hypothetical protein
LTILTMSSLNGFTSRKKQQITKLAHNIRSSFTSEECTQKAAHVCAICEEGGDLIFCDGPCMRHFHGHQGSRGANIFSCPGLRRHKDKNGTFICPDCKHKKAMCFECHIIGSFERVGESPPVLRKCPDPLCIRFFCFTCLPPEKESCRLHTCRACSKPESATMAEMVHCLRCSTTWHHTCLQKLEKDGYCTHKEIWSHEWKGELRHMFYSLLHLKGVYVDPNVFISTCTTT